MTMPPQSLQLGEKALQLKQVFESAAADKLELIAATQQAAEIAAISAPPPNASPPSGLRQITQGSTVVSK